MAEFEWAWMNLCTRCFGYHHLPNDIAMCPLMDQVNHAEEQATVRFFLFPWQVNRQMLEIEIDKRTNHEMMIDLHFEAMGVKQMPEEGLLCQDLNQHLDEYPDKYYNYQPLKILGRDCYPPKAESKTSEFWKTETISLTPYSDVWDLNNEKISFGLKLTNKNFKLAKHQQVNICYGERANSFLLVEYGFTIANNRYDFLRFSNLKVEDICKFKHPLYEEKIAEHNLKLEIRADLKIIGLNRDVLRMIRCNTDGDEIQVLKFYQNWL